MFKNARAALLSLVLVAVAVAVALPSAVAAQATQATPAAKAVPAAQSLAGTWKLNAAKSKYEPADAAAASSTVKYAFTGNSLTTTIDQVNTKGQKVHIEYTVNLDGTDGPWKGTIDGKPNPAQDGVSVKKLDANTYHVENKLKGKVLTVNHIVVAADGKSRTSTTTGTNAAGVKVHNVAVYEKQ